MAKNTLTDLNDHLFAQMERLGDEDLSTEDLQKEIKRAKSLDLVSGRIIENARTVLEAVRLKYNNVPTNERMPEVFSIEQKIKRLNP